MNKINNKKYIILIIPFAILVFLFEIMPLLSIIANSFFGASSKTFTFDNYKEVFTSEYYMLSIRNSLYVSVTSSLIGLFISSLGAYAIHTASEKLKKRFINILNMASNFQGIVLSFAFILLLGNSGVFTLLGERLNILFLKEYDLYTTSGILITFIYFQIPLATLLLYPSFDTVKDEYKEAAMLLNASNLQFWMKIGFPIVMPSILGTFSILFSNSLAAYATPYALLGNNYALLSIRISSMFTGDVVQKVELGSALSMVMIMLMGIVTLISKHILIKLRKD